MNKFLYSAIALTAASSVSFASGSDWLELDAGIASLSSNVATAEGPSIGGVLRSSYRDGGDMGGWVWDDADIWLSGASGDFTWRVNVDLDTGTAVLEDAWVAWATGNVNVTWGTFKNPFLRSNAMDPEKLLFIDRSALGAEFDTWDTGVAVSGAFEGLGWMVAITNGNDGADEEWNWFAHASYDLGNGACGCCDGAMHSSGDNLDASIGVSYHDMENDGDDAVIGADFAMTMGAISAQVEMADGGDDAVLEGENPWSVTIGYLFADNMEAAYRHDDRDGDDSDRDTFGLNWYLNGHQAKWQFNFIDDDMASDEVIAVGLSLGASR